MAHRITSVWCRHCDSLRAATQQTPNHLLHLLLTIATGGLWILVWIYTVLSSHETRCNTCGMLASTDRQPSSTAGVARERSGAAR